MAGQGKRLFIVVSVLLVSAVTTAWAAQVFNFNNPVSGSLNDGCTGDLQTFTGSYHAHFNVTDTPNGGFHIVYKQNLDDFKLYDTVTGLTCVGQNNTGAPFGAAGAFNTNPGGTTTLTMEARAAAVCPGPANNGDFMYVIHSTVDPSGNVTTFVDNFSSHCGQ